MCVFVFQATNGQALDRHLLGLKLICMETNTNLPELFRDKGFNYGLHFQLSTSQVCKCYVMLLQLWLGQDKTRQSLFYNGIKNWEKMLVRRVLSDRYRITQEQFQYQVVEIYMTSQVFTFIYRFSFCQVPSPCDTVLCFGPVVPDGYGVCYNPMEEHVNFTVSAFQSNPDTSSSRFAESIKASFDDLQKLLLKGKL